MTQWLNLLRISFLRTKKDFHDWWKQREDPDAWIGDMHWDGQTETYVLSTFIFVFPLACLFGIIRHYIIPNDPSPMGNYGIWILSFIISPFMLNLLTFCDFWYQNYMGLKQVHRLAQLLEIRISQLER